MSTLGDIATIAAPTVVALAAIGTSTWQQSRSRAFDRAEREKERQHDREMREAAELHERKLSDLDYQRKLVDDVTEALESANDAFVRLSRRWASMSPAERRSTADHPELEEALEAVGHADDRLKIVNARMILRFGPSHDAVRIIGLAMSAIRRAWRALVVRGTGEGSDREVTASVEAAYGELREAVNSFLTVTGGIVGSAPERD